MRCSPKFGKFLGVFNKFSEQRVHFLYVLFSDKNFSAIGQSLSRRTKLISSQIEERHDKSLQEMKLFVAKLPHLLAVKKSLGNRA